MLKIKEFILHQQNVNTKQQIQILDNDLLKNDLTIKKISKKLKNQLLQ
jgi:hypothetical protein